MSGAADRGALVLYDVPGPRARVRNRLLTLIGAAGVLAVAWVIYARFAAKGQWEAAKWEPFTQASTWTTFILRGLEYTLAAAALGMVLALAFGVIFAAGRLSDHWYIRWPSGVVVEFFRGVPLLLLIFFASYGMPFLLHRDVPALWAVVSGLTLYNGSVLAEAFRAGVLALPRGQTEAAQAIGLRKGQVLRLVLVPQAARAMLPVIVSQLVVLLKDTALGYIVAYPELLAQVNVINANHSNLVQTAMVVAAIYILLNLALGALAQVLERRFAPGRSARRAAIAAEELPAPAP